MGASMVKQCFVGASCWEPPTDESPHVAAAPWGRAAPAPPTRPIPNARARAPHEPVARSRPRWQSPHADPRQHPGTHGATAPPCYFAQAPPQPPPPADLMARYHQSRPTPVTTPRVARGGSSSSSSTTSVSSSRPKGSTRKTLGESASSVATQNKRERWGSRESTCSSSSGTEDELVDSVLTSVATMHESVGGTPSSSYTSTASMSRRSPRATIVHGFEELLPAHYSLEEMIGSGTTSKCYRCYRQIDGRWFACKVINKRRLAHDHSQRQRITRQLRHEIEILERLDHPNIAKLEESFENEKYIILVMELLEGGELFETIIERGRLSEADASYVARSVLSALHYMHGHGVIHRDIKPENLLLASPARFNSPLEVKIIDFGFSKVLGPSSTATSFLGTGGYLAPELLVHRPYSSSVDMWAFGVLVYLMLSGRLPFQMVTQLQPGQKVASAYRLTFPPKYWRGVSERSQNFLRELLVLNPRFRLTASAALQHAWIR